MPHISVDYDTSWYVQSCTHLLSAAEACYMLKDRFVIKLLHTSCSHANFGKKKLFNSRKEYLPRCWSSSLTFLSLLLWWRSQFKINRDILCYTKTVGTATSFICITSTYLFIGLNLKLSRLAFFWECILLWLKFLRKLSIKPFCVVPFFAVTWHSLFYTVPCFPGELGSPVNHQYK
jgi:hypothetical protein